MQRQQAAIILANFKKNVHKLDRATDNMENNSLPWKASGISKRAARVIFKIGDLHDEAFAAVDEYGEAVQWAMDSAVRAAKKL